MNIFATLSYGCAALAFLMLTVLLLTSWRGRRQGAFVIVACAATAAWAAVLAASNYFGSMPGSAIYYAEIGRSLAWLLAKPGVTAPIVGASKLPHLEEAVGALAITLDAAEMKILEEPYQPHSVLGHS